MLIRIIKKCNYECLHCMQNSGPDCKEVMSIEMFNKALDFTNLSEKTTMLIISGGEPMLHPEFDKILEILTTPNRLTYVKKIVILSNGSFIKNKYTALNTLLVDSIIESTDIDITLQITSIKGIYSNHIYFREIMDYFKSTLLLTNEALHTMVGKINYVDKLEHGIISVGRAKNNLAKLYNTTSLYPSKVTKCFNMYQLVLGLGKLNIIDLINKLKSVSKTSNCLPIIRENGDLSFGEYDVCSIEYNITNDTLDLDPRYITGPCGSCVSNDEMKMYHTQQKNNLKLLK